jgi:hypothetical protein
LLNGGKGGDGFKARIMPFARGGAGLGDFDDFSA